MGSVFLGCRGAIIWAGGVWSWLFFWGLVCFDGCDWVRIRVGVALLLVCVLRLGCTCGFGCGGGYSFWV